MAHRWGGTTFHDSGWNPCHIEGVEHFFYYNLERITGRHFIHGQPVGMGIVAGCLLQDNEPERMAGALHRAGVDIRPEAMGVTWDDVGEALRTLPRYVRDVDLWFSVADTVTITDDHVARVRAIVEGTFGTWPSPSHEATATDHAARVGR
jgi:glycerol dehydrogenase-like iron-containing ADH family enzyme